MESVVHRYIKLIFRLSFRGVYFLEKSFPPLYPPPQNFVNYSISFAKLVKIHDFMRKLMIVGGRYREGKKMKIKTPFDVQCSPTPPSYQESPPPSKPQGV